jgi:SSS family solute:Na+ symporter
MDISSKIQLIDYLIVAIYIVCVLGLGFYVSFRRGHTEDIFLGGRSLHWFNIGLSIFSTNVSPSMMIASCAGAYTVGMVVANFEWLAWIFLFLLAMIFVPHYLRTQVSTMPEFLQHRYNRSCREFLSWFAAFSTLWMWIGGTLFAGGILLEQILNWPLWFSVTFLSIIACSFTVTGGLKAVAITDTFQSSLMIGASIVLTLIGLHKVGGVDKLIHSVSPDTWKLFRPASDPNYSWPAIVLGYPVLGIFFWCTDQTIVQRVLGGRSLAHSQGGAIFAAFIKIITPLIFFVPGIMCRILHPDLPNDKAAYMTMVVNYMPTGGIGLIIAVLMAALIGTVAGGLNSFATITTLDIYKRYFNPDATAKKTKKVGQIMTVTAGVISILIALAIDKASDHIDLFSLGQAMIGYLAPPLAAVFTVGIIWRRATAKAAFLTLVLGSIVSMFVGALKLFIIPTAEIWANPALHFMLQAFYLFAGLCIFMVTVSLLTKHQPGDGSLEPLTISYLKQSGGKTIFVLWGTLAVIMLSIYLFFQISSSNL